MPDNEQNEKMRMLIPFQNGLNPLYSSISIKPRSGEVYSIQRYVIKFVRDLRQVGVFFRVFRFPPPIKLIATV